MASAYPDYDDDRRSQLEEVIVETFTGFLSYFERRNDSDEYERMLKLLQKDERFTQRVETKLKEQRASKQSKETTKTKERRVSKQSEEIIFKPEYVLVSTEENLKGCLSDLTESIKDDPILAVDCEGANLSRTGTLQILSVATRGKAYLVDLLTLKTRPFDAGLRAILENKDINKLMFDCRRDADALYHQFHVNLAGVLDIQLLEIIKRPQVKSDTSKKRSERLDEVVRLAGLLDCIETHLGDAGIDKIKKRGVVFHDKWGERPLPYTAQEYAATDVIALFQLFDKLRTDDEEMTRLEIASDIYVDLKRSMMFHIEDKYDNHCYLPIDVIPEKGQTSFDKGHRTCTTCKRPFPSAEFSKNQLSYGTQKCRTCKQVKLDSDVHKNRMDNLHRAGIWREFRMARDAQWEEEQYQDSLAMCYSDSD